MPSIAPSGLVFYTGDRFPSWQGDLFAGSLMIGRVARTGHLERIEFNEQGLESRGSGCWSISGSASATSGRAPTACCTC